MSLRCDLIIRDATVFDGTGGPASMPMSASRVIVSWPSAISAKWRPTKRLSPLAKPSHRVL